MPSRPTLSTIALITVLAAASTSAWADPRPVNCLIVGGGPDKQNNQVGIESNVRYVRSILPPGSTSHVLYTNGNPASSIVQCEDADLRLYFRPTTLTHIDGPASTHAFLTYLGYMDKGDKPLLLYFTGHGSPDRLFTFTNNAYDLWGEETITVAKMTKYVHAIDERVPLTMVMVQCFSGGFAPVFFQGSTPGHPHVRPNSCGFFACIAQREAAGCTSEVNEANYHDFTTYFFGALSGRDRVGRAVTDADYDGDGVVEMDEAYAYALIHDTSIDTPTTTSDAYVRKFLPDVDDDALFLTPYSTVISYATPAQRAAFEALSKQLGLDGEARLKKAYDVFSRRASVPEEDETEDGEERTARWIRLVRLTKTVILEHRIEATDADGDLRKGLDALLKAEHGGLLTMVPRS